MRKLLYRLLLFCAFTSVTTVNSLYAEDATSTITVKTGNVAAASTDARVYIQLIGDGWSTPFFRLDNSKNNFQKGKIDVFAYPELPVAPVTQIKLRHDNCCKDDEGPGWFVDHVILTLNDPCGHFGKQTFRINRWLALDEEEGALCVETDETSDRARACSR